MIATGGGAPVRSPLAPRQRIAGGVRWLTEASIPSFRHVSVDSLGALAERGIQVWLDAIETWPITGGPAPEGTVDIALTSDVPPYREWPRVHRSWHNKRAWIIQHRECPQWGDGVLDGVPPRLELVALKRWAERDLARLGTHKVTYIPHAFDGRIFHPGDRDAARHGLSLPTDVPLVAVVGSNVGLVDRKGIGDAIEAVRRYRDQSGLDARLALRTDRNGPARIPPEPWIAVLGPRSSEGIAALLRAADLLLHPAKAEPFGLPVIEAQACGAPVITTDIDGMSELVRTGSAVSAEREVVRLPGKIALGNAQLDGQITIAHPKVDELTEAIAYWIEQAPAPVSVRAAIDECELQRVTDEHWMPWLRSHGVKPAVGSRGPSPAAAG
jgi:glycosyltransferase involved in cell wall biosynthesis